jgi:hypothetical protein
VAISLVDPAEEKYLTEIEKLVKKKVLVHQPEDFSAEKAALAPSPRERRERGQRAPRPERKAPAPRDRQQEREDAYARNPDQPLPRSTSHSRTTRDRDVPMLLKRQPVSPKVQTVAVDSAPAKDIETTSG